VPERRLGSALSADADTNLSRGLSDSVFAQAGKTNHINTLFFVARQLHSARRAAASSRATRATPSKAGVQNIRLTGTNVQDRGVAGQLCCLAENSQRLPLR